MRWAWFLLVMLLAGFNGFQAGYWAVEALKTGAASDWITALLSATAALALTAVAPNTLKLRRK